MALPPPGPNQQYCNVSVLDAGLIDLHEVMFISNAVPGKITRAPSLSFLIEHPSTGKKFVFDLGIRKDSHNYPPVILEWIRTTYSIQVDQDVVESLAKGGTAPTDIDYVCLSHCHWDHTGNTHPFTKSTFLVGAECQSLFNPGYPEDPNGSFPSDLLPQGRTTYLDPTNWPSIGPFPRALDFFEDGSLYIVDAPGHLSGHVNVLVRTSDDGGWIYLAGDSAHHWNLITLASDIAVGHSGHADSCAHQDKEAAEEHIRRINLLWKLPRVQIFLAHDEPWYTKKNDGSAFWPGKIKSF
jgi:glyoxylase-like metal-dependent hydrolase (beta-lactamase superfamily II)